MKRVSIAVAALLCIGFMNLVASANPGHEKMSALPDTPEWQKLKTLVGDWEGVIEEGGKKTACVVDVRMTGGGSALVHTAARGTPMEMVTVFHPDGRRLMATHYCALHNQPRMALAPSPGADKVAFTYLDGTNIAPGDPHITGVVITFIDADHHDETWSSTMGDAVFKYTRKK